MVAELQAEAAAISEAPNTKLCPRTRRLVGGLDKIAFNIKNGVRMEGWTPPPLPPEFATARAWRAVLHCHAVFSHRLLLACVSFTRL